MIEVAILVGRKIRKVYGKKQVAQEVLKGIDLEVNEGVGEYQFKMYKEPMTGIWKWGL